MLRIPISHTVTLQNFLISSFYLVGLKTNCQLVNIGSVSNDEYQIDHNNIGGEGGGVLFVFFFANVHLSNLNNHHRLPSIH